MTEERALQIAERIAREAHAGQKEESTGDDYICHVERVVAMVDGEEAKIVAWLHDVLEDSSWTATQLETNGIRGSLVASVKELTRVPQQPYAHYIRDIQLSGDGLAITVKVADLRDHLRPNCPPSLRPRYEAALRALIGGPAVTEERRRALPDREAHRQYRKRPVVVHAVQWTGANVDDVLDLIHGHAEARRHVGVGSNELHIDTLEGTMRASMGDWIVRGVKGECYPVKPDIFAMTYEPEAEAARAVDPPQEAAMSSEQKALRLLLPAIPQGNDWHADRYDTDDSMVLKLWRTEGSEPHALQFDCTKRDLLGVGIGSRSADEDRLTAAEVYLVMLQWELRAASEEQTRIAIKLGKLRAQLIRAGDSPYVGAVSATVPVVEEINEADATKGSDVVTIIDPKSPKGQQMIQNAAYFKPTTQGDPPPETESGPAQETGLDYINAWRARTGLKVIGPADDLLTEDEIKFTIRSLPENFSTELTARIAQQLRGVKPLREGSATDTAGVSHPSIHDAARVSVAEEALIHDARFERLLKEEIFPAGEDIEQFLDAADESRRSAPRDERDVSRAEHLLRQEWWMNHGCPFAALYGDDGEMQCNAGTCMRDFKRDPLDVLEQHVDARRAERTAKAVAEYVKTAAPAPRGERLTALLEKWDRRADGCRKMYLQPQARILDECAAELAAVLGLPREEHTP